jgi:hypothetical protein
VEERGGGVSPGMGLHRGGAWNGAAKLDFGGWTRVRGSCFAAAMALDGVEIRAWDDSVRYSAAAVARLACLEVADAAELEARAAASAMAGWEWRHGAAAFSSAAGVFRTPADGGLGQ